MFCITLALLTPTALPILSPPASASDNWPAFRGSAGSGVATGTPPIEFGQEQNLRWKVPVPGKGNSSPIVWGERVYLTTAVGTGNKDESAPAEAETERAEEDAGERERPRGEGRPQGRRGGDSGRGRGGRRGAPQPLEEQDFLVIAFDRGSGEVAWESKVNTAMPHQGTHPDGTYASATLVTDGERIYASFGSFGIYALSLEGDVLWQTDLGDLDIMRSFGEGSSPVLHGEVLIHNWDHEGDSFLVALDKTSGEERWRTVRSGGTSWSTPVIVQVDGRDQLVIAGSPTIGYDPNTGAILWTHGDEPNGRGGGLIASPAVVDELVIFPGGGRTGELSGLVVPAVTEDDGEPEGLVLWTERGLAPHVPSLLAYERMVYALKQNSGILAVIDATTGESKYGPERLSAVSDVYASPIAAGGRVYIAGRDGTVEVLSAWPQIATLAVNTLDERVDATPAVAGNELYLRSYEHLYCFAE